MNAIDKLISVAYDEVGYLEKSNTQNLYDKEKNPGCNNYTKYWADIKPEYQGQPWCAAFVTWCFVKAFGKENAKKLLKHYPFVYCPTLAGLSYCYSNPIRGDIVLFYRRGEFVHTGIVVYSSGDYFETIEGNTSGGNSIVENGGGVYKKYYYNSMLPGTKFIRPNYTLVDKEVLSVEQYNELKAMIVNLTELIHSLTKDVIKLKSPMIYNYIDENMPEWAIPTVRKLVNKGFLKGDEGGLNLTDDLLRILVINDRAGLYGE